MPLIRRFWPLLLVTAGAVQAADIESFSINTNADAPFSVTINLIGCDIPIQADRVDHPNQTLTRYLGNASLSLPHAEFKAAQIDVENNQGECKVTITGTSQFHGRYPGQLSAANTHSPTANVP